MTSFLTIKKSDELREIKALLDSDLKAVTDANGNVRFVTPDHDSGREVMTIAEVAALLGVNQSVVRQMTKARAQRGPHPIPFHRVSGKMIRFRRDEIMNWIATTPKRVTRKANRAK
jgi:excisionase family DNA binding protein